MGFADWLYGLDGEPIDEATFEALAEQRDRIEIGRTVEGEFVVVTQWCGVSAAVPPLIYETIVWHLPSGDDVERSTYPTRELAELGHQEAVQRRMAGQRDPGNTSPG